MSVITENWKFFQIFCISKILLFCQGMRMKRASLVVQGEVSTSQTKISGVREKTQKFSENIHFSKSNIFRSINWKSDLSNLRQKNKKSSECNLLLQRWRKWHLLCRQISPTYFKDVGLCDDVGTVPPMWSEKYHILT